jgi:hypothetical protein
MTSATRFSAKAGMAINRMLTSAIKPSNAGTASSQKNRRTSLNLQAFY